MIVTATKAEVRDMPFADYLGTPGLSFHGLKDLAISPLRYWFNNVRPDREPEEQSEYTRFGQALHSAVLEPHRFRSEYARAINPAQIEGGCLDTIEEIRAWIKQQGRDTKGSGTRKAEVIAFAQQINPDVPILQVIEERHLAMNEGKTILKWDEYDRVAATADSVLSEPKARDLLADCEFEQCLFAPDPRTNVVLKGRLDATKPKATIDLKTFSMKRERSIDEVVCDAIWNEKYHWQAFHYAVLRGWPEWKGDHVLIFVESEPPHEVRIKTLRATNGGQVNVYWDRARIEIRGHIDRYAECVKQFGVGERPWRWAQEADLLIDEELKGLVFA